MLQRPLCLILWSGCFALASSAAAVAAPILLDFDNGKGTTSVDQYAGIAGDGWASAWGPKVQGTIVNASTAVVSSNPLVTGGGNYLAMNVTSGTSGSTKTVSVNRTYENGGAMGVDRSQPHRVSFLFRFDSGFANFTETTDYVFMTDQPAGSYFADGTTSSWMIRAHAAATGSAAAQRWAFYDGNPASTTLDTSRFQDSGVALVEGHTYRFTIDTNPAARTYTASVEDLATSDRYTSGDLRFRNFISNPTEAGGQLLLGMRYNTSGLNRVFAIDQVAITTVPEPSIMGLAFLAALAAQRRSPRPADKRGVIVGAATAAAGGMPAPPMDPALERERLVVMRVRSRDVTLRPLHGVDADERRNVNLRGVPLFVDGKSAPPERLAKGMPIAIARDPATGAVVRVDAGTSRPGDAADGGGSAGADGAESVIRRVAGRLMRVEEDHLVAALGSGARGVEVIVPTLPATAVVVDGAVATMDALKPGMALYITQSDGLTTRIEARQLPRP